VVEDGQNFINFETMGMVMVNEKDLSAA